MRYGLSLLVCFALAIGANAAEKPCTGDKCKNQLFDGIVVAPVQTVAKAVVAVPAAVVRGVSGSCCGSQVSAAPVQRTGPIRQFFRNLRGR